MVLAHSPPPAPHDAPPRPALRYVRAPRPLHFPVEALVPETRMHLDLRTLLYYLLRDELGERATLGSDQFVYWDASNPRQCLSPDAFVRFGVPDAPFTSWKTWERGAPEIAVEIVSDSDAPEPSWEEKLTRYGRLGVEEVVRFDPSLPAGQRLRVWDRVEGDLVERVVEEDRAASRWMKLWWVVAPAEGYEAALRLSRDEEGGELVATRSEAREAEAKAREAEAKAREAEAKGRAAEAKGRKAAEAEARAATEAREAAEARVRELEAELRRRGG